MKYKNYIMGLFIMTGLIVFVLCKKDNKKPTQDSSQQPVTPSEPIYYYGDTVWLNNKNCVKITNTKKNIDSTITLCIDTVYEGRCYKSNCAFCDYGFAVVFFKVKTKTDSFSLRLNIRGCMHGIEQCCDSLLCGKDTLNLKFCILKLLPEPDFNNMPLSMNQYNAKIKVKKL